MSNAIHRGLRTFFAGAAAVLTGTAVVGAAQTGDWKIGSTALVLGLVTAAVAGVVSFVQTQALSTPAITPLDRSIRTFYQILGSGLVTVGLAELTNAAAISFAHAAIRAGVVALIAAAGTYSLASSEEGAITEADAG